MMLRLIANALALFVVSACAPIEMHEELAQPVQTVITAGIGDPILRIDRSEDLPNVFGRADVYGRKRDAGFTEVRFVGIDNGKPVFERSDVEIKSNETTMSRSGMLIGSTNSSAYSHGNATTFQGTTTVIGAADDEAMVFPARTLRFQVDWPSERSFATAGHTVNIVDVSGSHLRYELR